MRAKYDQSGPDIFANHELLEMLLYHSLKQGNTNTLAHAILDQSPLGGIGRSSKSISQIDGIGDVSANLLRVSFDTTVRLLCDALLTQPLDCDFSISTYLWLWMLNKPEKCVAALLLGNRGKLILCSLIAEGRTVRPEDYARELTALMERHNAKKAVICHNHADGDCTPSVEDLYLATYLEKELSANGLCLLSNYIATQSRCQSFGID